MEFQAVVMAAGKGSRMTEITSGCPKCLLPVGNLPLIFYPLYMLKQAGFQDVIVIVPEVAKTKLTEALSGKLDMKLDVVAIPSQEEWGTADSLRHIKSKIKTDIIVVTCDLVTDFSLRELADVFRAHDASLAVLLSVIPPSLVDASVPGYKGKQRGEKDIIGIDSSSGRLVLLNSEADFEEEIPMKLSLLRRNPVIQVYSNLVDGHVYIMKKWLLDYLADNEHISTLKGELLPVLVKKQYQNQKTQENLPQVSSSVMSVNPQKDIYSYIKEDEIKNLVCNLSKRNNNLASQKQSKQISCYSHIIKDNLFIRANTLKAYGEVNRQISRYLLNISNKLTNITKPLVLPMLQHNKAQIGNDCIVGENPVIGEKVSIKRSVIGNNCQLKDKVKITNSVIMDNVTVEEGCSIQGSIVCSNTYIGKQCEFKDSIIGRSQQVNDFCKLTNQVLQDVNRLLEI